MMNVQGKQALVLGLGESGLAMALWLARCGAAVRVADTRTAPDRLPALQAQAPDAVFIGGARRRPLRVLVEYRHIHHAP